MPQEIEQIFNNIRTKLESVIIGQSAVIDLILTAILAEGHVLLEGVPGTAKTLMIKLLSQLIEADFSRIQLTPDMLPSDILGNSIFDMTSRNFYIREGAIFTDLLLADEINRTPPKTQSALLEAMEERQVTIDTKTSELGELFTVFATQNPIEFEGTYPLPEAQLDRFMFKINLDYPSKDAEKKMLMNAQEGITPKKFKQKPLEPACTKADIIKCRQKAAQITVEESILDYIVEIVSKTRNMADLSVGASPRSAVMMLNASKAHAGINGQDYVTPDNVKVIAKPLLRHRLVLTPDAELEGVTTDHIINGILSQVPVPR